MQIIPTKQFNSDTEFYIRKKKFFKITEDIKSVVAELLKGNLIGDRLDNIKLNEGTAVYKVRVPNSSTKSGKSNGFRLIYYYVVIDEKIYLLSIYSKKDDKKILNDKQIELLVKNLIEDINDS